MASAQLVNRAELGLAEGTEVGVAGPGEDAGEAEGGVAAGQEASGKGGGHRGQADAAGRAVLYNNCLPSMSIVKKGVLQKGRFTVSNTTEESDADIRMRRGSLYDAGPLLESHPSMPADNDPLEPGSQAPMEQEHDHPSDSKSSQRTIKPFSLKPYLENMPIYAASTSALPEPPSLSLGPPNVPVPPPLPPKIDTPDHSEIEEKRVPIGLIMNLQDRLSEQFTEMMDLHKSVMVDMIAKDQRRDAQLRDLMEGHLELVKASARLQIEQMRLRERLYSRD